MPRKPLLAVLVASGALLVGCGVLPAPQPPVRPSVSATSAAPTPTTTVTVTPPTSSRSTAPSATAPSTSTDTAASRYGWGTPIAAGSDEFNAGVIDGGKWSQPSGCWPANDTVKGGRCADHNAVKADGGVGYFRETGTPDGRTGYLASRFGQRYGRWELRARITGGPGSDFHPVGLLWPVSGQWPQGGELDFLEVNTSDTKATAFMHHPTQSGVVQDQYTSGPLKLSDWHNYAIDWQPTGITGYIDGVQWFHDAEAGFDPPGPMYLCFQLDNFVGISGMETATFDADWIRVYKP